MFFSKENCFNIDVHNKCQNRCCGCCDSCRRVWCKGDPGPRGQTGPAGAAATINGYYDDYESFIREHPTGTAGEMYIVDGVLYTWNTATGAWRALGSVVGPTGPAGEAATIDGYYDDYNTFIQAHPTGTAGEMYIVDGILYTWDTATGAWRALGSLIGPTGPAGDVATISGYYDDYNTFIQEHPTGTAGEMYIVDGILYVWDEENQAWKELGSLIGPTGPAGEISTISGYYDDYATFIQEHPTGVAGEMYIVEGILYIWDEENQAWNELGSLMGPTGPAGDAAAAVTIIPFASQQAPLVASSAGGLPTNAALIGFGYLPNADSSVSIDPNDRSFNLSLTANNNSQVAFSLPFDMKINSLYITVGNYDEFPFPPSGTMVYPYVQIYAAEPATNSFSPIAGAVARPVQGIDPQSAVEATMRSAAVEGLDIGLRAGTRIAICGLMEVTGDTAARQYYLYYTGGIGMSRWIEEA